MSRRNGKVCAYLGPYTKHLRRFLVLPHTEPGPNFIRKADLQEGMEGHLKFSPLLEVCDANGNPLSIFATVRCRFGLAASWICYGFLTLKNSGTCHPLNGLL